jgi:hypothetical protein
MKRAFAVASALGALCIASQAHAGNVFLTGHDPDFHAQDEVSGQHELAVALKYVTGGSYNDGSTKFLWVESFNSPDGAHRVGFNGLATIGVGASNVDWVDAAGFATADLSDYSAVVVASSFGGMLTDAEIDGLVARKSAIADFVNAGGGLAAFAECGPTFGANCNASNVTASTPLFGFVPVSASAVATLPPYTLTPFGLSLGLVPTDVNDCCTHNSFGGPAGLQIVDTDQNGVPTTLAGSVRITDNGFRGVPEPATWALLIAGFGAVGAAVRRRRPALVPA